MLNNMKILTLIVTTILVINLSGCSPLNLFSNSTSMKAEDFYKDKLQIDLLCAVADGDKNRIAELVSLGADVDAVGHDSIRPIFWALAHNNLSGFESLLEHGAEINFSVDRVEDNGHVNEVSPMELIAAAPNSKFLSTALDHGGDPNYVIRSYYPDGKLSSEETIIYSAILHEQRENVVILADAGADLNYQSKEFIGTTPMMSAANINNYNIVWLLLEKGADPSIKDKIGYDLASQMKFQGTNGVNRNQLEWYKKVVSELNERGLW